ncbi:heptosyltransferase-1/heptosyltransferase-3 [Abditibacterium utsteinense]|uniref:Heptosyltransferase-1/heptosyltransferase-3 n=1 Tax=Abditibacterium utsteinense TaxID=1960156 RepID=A0A2S8SX99_9BACT|nr:glycosyltransferase family 9 protein [Abditibacterium utsteinense]PQV65379.1 heptosyltransferase-1/heptosyltransferase-3 [Abditibacterium utsteinense]
MQPIPLLDSSDFARRYAWEPLPFPMPTLPEAPRILILKLSAIGDCLIASPLARALRERYPRAHIAWAVQSKARAVVEGNPFLDEILVWQGGSWRGALRLALEVRRGRFDAVLDLQGSSKTLPMLALSGAKVRAVSGRAKKISRAIATCVAPIREPQPHAGEQYFRVAQCLDIAPDARRDLIMPIGDADRQWAQTFWRQHDLEGKRVVALNPGSARAIKQWPPAQFAQLARMLEQSGTRTLILGAPGEVELALEIARAATQPETQSELETEEATGVAKSPSEIAVDSDTSTPLKPIVAAGQTTLKQLGALLQHCDLMVSADTGPMHIAAAVGTPIVALFGPTDPACTGPVSARARVVMRDLPCRPCFQQPTCDRFECLTELDASTVFSIAHDQMQRFGPTLPLRAPTPLPGVSKAKAGERLPES